MVDFQRDALGGSFLRMEFLDLQRGDENRSWHIILGYLICTTTSEITDDFILISQVRHSKMNHFAQHQSRVSGRAILPAWALHQWPPHLTTLSCNERKRE